MRRFVSAYQEVFSCTPIAEESIKKHIEQQIIINELLPESASFFYLVTPSTLRYHFVGKQQRNVSGYTNEEFIKGGIKLFLQSVHPDELEILTNQIYPAYTELIINSEPQNRKKIQFQYNYRFRRKDGVYRNLLEQVYALKSDQAGKPSLILGNVIILGDNDFLPVRATAKLITDSGLSETIFSKAYSTTPNKLFGLTLREIDILRNLVTGKTSKQIGDSLCISPHTVDTHRRNLLKKMNCHSMIELAQLAFKNGLL